MMPPAGAALRGRQSALLAGLAHSWATDPRIEGWLSELDETDAVQRACKRNLGRTYARERRVSAQIVDDLALAKSEGFAAWLDAKGSARFDTFAPALQRIFEEVGLEALPIEAPHRMSESIWRDPLVLRKAP